MKNIILMIVIVIFMGGCAQQEKRSFIGNKGTIVKIEFLNRTFSSDTKTIITTSDSTCFMVYGSEPIKLGSTVSFWMIEASVRDQPTKQALINGVYRFICE